MNVDTLIHTIGQAVDLARDNSRHIAVGAGAVGALIAAYAIRRFTRHREHDDLAATLGVVLFGVVTTEGMWEVVRHKLGVNPALTVAMFAAFDVVIYSQGRLAIRKLTGNPRARVGTYLAIIWALSAAASLTVSTAGGNTTTQLFRFFSPLVAAALWTQKVLELRSGTVERTESNWIWTPTRLMIRWGWVKPGAADDLTETFRQRRINALVDAGLELYVQQQAVKLHAGAEPDKRSRWPWPRTSPLVAARRRVQHLTKTADPADVAAARKQLRLTLNIERELFRDDEPTERDRQTLDQVRLVTSRAVDRVRMDHARAFGPDQVDHRTIAGIRMPAHIADQIPDHIPAGWVDQHRTKPVDQTGPDQAGPDHGPGPDRTSRPNVDHHIDPAGPDQTTSRVDQAPTSAVPAARAGTKVQTTVRVDQVKPAAGDPVPPRVQAMVHKLREAYPDVIPARRTVMDHMGWTSHQDARTAINLVRVERTKTSTGDRP